MIRLLVDSASDISVQNLENIMVVPLSVNINNNVYLDGVELGHDEFYEMLTETNDFPKTSQPSPQAFVDEFEKVKEAGDELICILLSSGVSGTYQSACLAKSIVEYDKIHVVDSLTGAYGVKLLVLEAQRCIEKGMSALEIVEKLEDLRKRVQVILSVDTLEYLYKGGRLDKKSAVIGSIAKVKPVIEVTKEGKIGVLGKTIGMVKAMNKIVDVINDKQVDKNYPVYTIYTKGTKNVEKLESKMNAAGVSISERVQLGPVVGTHLGPEAFGTIFVSKK